MSLPASESIYCALTSFARYRMRFLPLFKFGHRARATSWGIALCTTFIVASFSVVAGLGNSMDALERNFESDYYLVTKPGQSGLEFFSEFEVGGEIQLPAFGVLTSARVGPSGPEVNVFAISAGSQPLPGIPTVTGDNMLAGPDASFWGIVTLSGVATVTANITGYFQSPIFPSGWLLGSMSLLETLSGSERLYNFVIGESIAPDSADSLTENGYVVQPMVGIIDFLDSSVTEVKEDVMWALLPSAFVIVILAYSFIGTETADKRHEIGVMKTVGAGRRRILAYLLSNALIICAWGGLLGIALGIVISYGISTVASSLFSSVLIVKAGELLLIEAYVATVLAGFIGALIPSIRMTLSSPVDDLREVAPSY